MHKRSGSKKLQIFHKIMSFIKSLSIKQIWVLRFSSIEQVWAAIFRASIEPVSSDSMLKVSLVVLWKYKRIAKQSGHTGEQSCIGWVFRTSNVLFNARSRKCTLKVWKDPKHGKKRPPTTMGSWVIIHRNEIDLYLYI